MNRKIIMGVDTSNYTTSIALLYDDGELIANLKSPLPVKSGDCGLRQSDAVFAHTKNIPELMMKARDILDGRAPSAIGVSVKPRNVEGSYMPCFLSGRAAAYSVACALGIKLYEFSHQCGHIMAALYSSGATELTEKTFAALHLSGGTSELLTVTPSKLGFDASVVGGTNDLNAGQVIDRVGVYMGLPFPAGVHMERLAAGFEGRIPKKRPSVSGLFFNLSGLENMAKQLYDKTHDKALVSSFVFNYVFESVDTICTNYRVAYGDTPFVFAGGVMSNSIIKEKLSERSDVYFAEPSLSADNAVGIAVLSKRRFIAEAE